MRVRKATCLLALLAVISCDKNAKFKTPPEYVNSVKVTPTLFTSDSASILNDLYDDMKNHREPFRNPEYFDSTKLYLDTMFYDYSYEKVAFLLIAQNPVNRNPHLYSDSTYYYNAFCFLGKRKMSDSNRFETERIGPVSIINFEDAVYTKQAIRESYCARLISSLDENGVSHWEFNINDTRFWDSDRGWKRVFP